MYNCQPTIPHGLKYKHAVNGQYLGTNYWKTKRTTHPKGTHSTWQNTTATTQTSWGTHFQNKTNVNTSSSLAPSTSNVIKWNPIRVQIWIDSRWEEWVANLSQVVRSFGYQILLFVEQEWSCQLIKWKLDEPRELRNVSEFDCHVSSRDNEVCIGSSTQPVRRWSVEKFWKATKELNLNFIEYLQRLHPSISLAGLLYCSED